MYNSITDIYQNSGIAREYVQLASRLLTNYRLTTAERLDETERLARAIQQAAQEQLETIDDRKPA